MPHTDAHAYMALHGSVSLLSAAPRLETGQDEHKGAEMRLCSPCGELRLCAVRAGDPAGHTNERTPSTYAAVEEGTQAGGRWAAAGRHFLCIIPPFSIVGTRHQPCAVWRDGGRASDANKSSPLAWTLFDCDTPRWKSFFETSPARTRTVFLTVSPCIYLHPPMSWRGYREKSRPAYSRDVLTAASRRASI